MPYCTHYSKPDVAGHGGVKGVFPEGNPNLWESHAKGNPIIDGQSQEKTHNLTDLYWPHEWFISVQCLTVHTKLWFHSSFYITDFDTEYTLKKRFDNY